MSFDFIKTSWIITANCTDFNLIKPQIKQGSYQQWSEEVQVKKETDRSNVVTKWAFHFYGADSP